MTNEPTLAPAVESEKIKLPSALLILLSAPSGGGKTTLCQQLLAHHPEVTRACTCTTRPPRPGEREGVDYYFLEPGDFLKRVQAGEFLEHATVYGNSYGILKSEVLGKLHQGKDVILNVDVQGAATIRSRASEDAQLQHALVTVFLTPATFEELETRLTRRGTDSVEELETRLSLARHELAQWKNFQYLITSTTIPEDFRRMESIIEAERMRQIRVSEPYYKA
jgi:guanylate kinase